MRVGAKTVLGISLVLVVLVMALTSVYQYPLKPASSRLSSGTDWESKKCMKDTREVRPYAFQVCYDRNSDSLQR
jgi:hypothetical protein